MARRPHLPEAVKFPLLYASAFACAVCHARAAHIHHIDKDNTNNDPKNLVALCQSHHDDAHTVRELSQNLTPARLRASKKLWEEQVAARRATATTWTGQKGLAEHEFLSVGIAWGYINHRRIATMLTSDIVGAAPPALLRRCIDRSVTDENGIILKPDNAAVGKSYIQNSVYDWFPYGDDHALHSLYSVFVDAVALKLRPVHIDELSWGKAFAKNMLGPGSTIFFVRGQYFRKVSETEENAHVHVLARKAKLHVEYFVDTRDMFGTTSMTVSFTGHRSCASLLIVKSLDRVEDTVTLQCTPLALGVGFKGAAD